MSRLFAILFTLLWIAPLGGIELEADTVQRLERRIDGLKRELESQIRDSDNADIDIERRVTEIGDDATSGIGLIVSGIFCAVWAQYTRRSAWLWFFFGVFLAPLALICLVWKNMNGLSSGELRFWSEGRNR